MAGILPEMSIEESLDMTRIYSMADQLPAGTPLIRHRPFSLTVMIYHRIRSIELARVIMNQARERGIWSVHPAETGQYRQNPAGIKSFI